MYPKQPYYPHKKGIGPKGSQTPGVKKGIRPSTIQRYMCRHNRSWKHPLYEITMASLGNRKKGTS
jgi:hypothetical protein